MVRLYCTIEYYGCVDTNIYDCLIKKPKDHYIADPYFVLKHPWLEPDFKPINHRRNNQWTLQFFDSITYFVSGLFLACSATYLSFFLQSFFTKWFRKRIKFRLYIQKQTKMQFQTGFNYTSKINYDVYRYISSQ